MMGPALPEDAWQALEEAFAWARDQEASVQSEFVEALRQNRPDLAQDLAAMLGDVSRLERFDAPDFDEGMVQGLSRKTSRVGEEIGPYRISAVLASGGMGDVFKAERADGAFEQVVAIKFLREGLQHGSFATRFLQERQMLAQLQHPNIGGLLDGGSTEEGIPYLVMDFVHGRDLLRYVKEEKLNLTAKLEIALEICDAVQYAHQQLVIHRDLKPSNILVDESGHPMLLDFGIAKLLDSGEGDAELTLASFPVMTPEYASPEQTRGEAVGTASDIYSLGVVLYRMFGGHAPYELDGLSRFDIAKRVTESIPASLHQKDSSFPRDLDAILLRCMQKQSDRRYASAHSLGEDLRRFQQGKPVLARPDSAWYRLNRFVARNRLPVAFAGAAFLAGVIGLTAYIQTSQVAVRKALTTSRVSQFLTDFFSTPDPWAQGLGDMSMQDFFDNGLDIMFADLDEEPEVRAELAAALGKVLLNLGDEKQAIALLQAALDAEPQMEKRDPATAAGIHFDLGVAQRRSGLLEQAESNLRKVLELRSGFMKKESEEMASAWNTLGLVHHTMGEFESAQVEYETALAIRQSLAGPDAPTSAATWNNLGALAMGKGELDAAVKAFERALRIHQKQFATREHPDLATTLNNLGMGLEAQGDYDAAEARFHESLAMRRRLLAADHPHIAGSINNLGLLEESRGNIPAAAERFREALAVILDKAPEGHPLRLRIEENLNAMEE